MPRLPRISGAEAVRALQRLGFEIARQRGSRDPARYRRAIKMAEDRLWFKDTMTKIGLDVPSSVVVTTVERALEAAERLGFPLIIRPSFTLGGTGSGVAYNREEFAEKVRWGLDLSPVHEVLIEESVLGWKEFELEVMRDHADNAVVVCSI